MAMRGDFLLTVAEIAIAFAGFASIVSVLGRQGSRDDPRLDGWRLRGMLEAALTVVLRRSSRTPSGSAMPRHGA